MIITEFCHTCDTNEIIIMLFPLVSFYFAIGIKALVSRYDVNG